MKLKTENSPRRYTGPQEAHVTVQTKMSVPLRLPLNLLDSASAPPCLRGSSSDFRVIPQRTTGDERRRFTADLRLPFAWNFVLRVSGSTDVCRSLITHL